MKKNLMSVVILALVVANLILTAVLTISILPQTKQANELINKVCAAIDLDLEGGTGENTANVPMEQVEAYSFNNGENLTLNLKPGEDGVEHYAVLKVTLGIDTKHKDYKKFGSAEALAAKEGLMADRISQVVSSHTLEEMRDEREKVQSEMLTALQDLYDSTVIVSVSFIATYQ